MVGQLYCLASNPDKQQKLYEEIMELTPDKRSPITYEVMQKASYLKACIKEGFRLVTSFTVVAEVLRSACLSVCLRVHPFAYLKNHKSKFHEIFCICYGSVLLSRDYNGFM